MRPRRPQDRRSRARIGPASGDDYEWPETALWAALRAAGPEGVSVADLETACGMRRRWVYYRLREHAAAGRAVQVTRGSWRAVPPAGGASGDGRPPPRPAPGRPPGRPGKRRRPGGNGE